MMSSSLSLATNSTGPVSPSVAMAAAAASPFGAVGAAAGGNGGSSSSGATSRLHSTTSDMGGSLRSSISTAPSTPSHLSSSSSAGGAAAVVSQAIAVAGGSSSSSSPFVNSAYDWGCEENLSKWRGMFVASLEKVLRQVHPSLMATDDALRYVEDLILRLLAMLTAKPVPVSVSDIEERVSKTFPTPIDRWALTEAQQAIDRGKKKSTLVLPVDKVHPMLREVLQNRVDEHVTIYLVAVLEYISADILKLAGGYVKNIRHMQISCQDIKVAMNADKVLMDMFQQEQQLLYSEDDDPGAGGVSGADGGGGSGQSKKSQTYDEVVKDLIMDEKQYLRDLHMITKVFRDIMQKYHIGSAKEIDCIFSNITDVTELTVTLISSLEDTLEMTEEGNVPAVGACFEELAEAAEFDVYEKYARDILSPKSRQTLDSLLPRNKVSEYTLKSCGKGFREAVKFYLPKLLLGPIYHCFQYFSYIELLRKLTKSSDDCDSLKQVSGMMSPLQNKLQQLVQNAGPAAKRKPGDIFHRTGPSRVSRHQAMQKLRQLQQSIVNWDGHDLVANSSEIVWDGKLKVQVDKGKKYKEQTVFLCDGMILICKQHTAKPSSSSSHSSGSHHGHSGGGQPQVKYRLRERHLIRRVDVLDREDTATEKYTFELAPREKDKLVFKAESEEEKNCWMAALVMLNTKFMLERLLDVVLSNEEKLHPLRFPPPDKYEFAEPDSPNNIVYEEKEKSSGVPLIKGATLVKLVERLTYHVYADPMFMKTFLTTYRSFCTPKELLDLLIKRFHIPEPEFSSDSESDSDGHAAADKSSKMRMAQDLKRFRKEYSQPVQFRVLNVLKHWVDQHFYDFEDDDLLATLNEFLAGIVGKSMRKWAECINKIVQRRLSHDDKDKDIIFDFDRSPPPIERHIENPEEDWPELLTYHPIEIARQLTLLEFQYYRAVKPSELVDQAWTREDKDKRSPNLLKMVRHTTNFTRYLEKLIVETENIEERAAVMNRTLDIMMVLQEYNNFNGVLAITSALNSSAVYRLGYTKDRVPKHYLTALKEASAYIEDHFRLYWAKLRSINPPCVPFFGQYQTNILFLEEGNPDVLHNTDLINFAKRRKVAEIISEIQQYQNQPYCLSVEPDVKAFLENLNPFRDMNEREVTDYLWAKSSEIEPRNAESDPALKKRITEGKPKWEGLKLRSPGTKPKNLPGRNHPNPLPRIRQPSSRHSGGGGGGGGGSSSAADDPSRGGGGGIANSGLEMESPLTSPVFRSSSSGPSTPSYTPTALSAAVGYGCGGGGGDNDPIKIPLNLPLAGPSSSSAGGGVHSSSPALPPPIHNAIPPPLPPKPKSAGAAATGAPAVPSRTGSPPPPPLPPRTMSRGLQNALAASAEFSLSQPRQPRPPPPRPAEHR